MVWIVMELMPHGALNVVLEKGWKAWVRSSPPRKKKYSEADTGPGTEAYDVSDRDRERETDASRTALAAIGRRWLGWRAGTGVLQALSRQRRT